MYRIINFLEQFQDKLARWQKNLKEFEPRYYGFFVWVWLVMAISSAIIFPFALDGPIRWRFTIGYVVFCLFMAWFTSKLIPFYAKIESAIRGFGEWVFGGEDG